MTQEQAREITVACIRQHIRHMGILDDDYADGEEAVAEDADGVPLCWDCLRGLASTDETP